MLKNKVIEVKIPVNSISVKKETILRSLGYENKEYEPVIEEMAIKHIEESKRLINPKGGFIIHKLNKIVAKEGILEVHGIIFHINRIIAAQLKDAEYIAFFICTIGKDLERHSKKLLSEGDALEGYLFDLIASETAEETASIVHEEIKITAEKHNLGSTNRFSPGYCNWDVKEQFKLFGLFPDLFCGISLTGSALMAPIKSVSGVIGIGKNVKFKPYYCSKCDDQHCLYRNRQKQE